MNDKADTTGGARTPPATTEINVGTPATPAPQPNTGTTGGTATPPSPAQPSGGAKTKAVQSPS